MRSSRMHAKPALRLAFVVFIGIVTGCSIRSGPEGYPDHIVFELRQDGLVDALPQVIPDKLEPAGELNEGIERINQRGGRVLSPAKLSNEQRESIRNILSSTFNIPARPKIHGDEETLSLVTELGLNEVNLAEGSRLFRRHCQQCHGVNGDGRGTNAGYLNPHPRDYRQAVFKFTTTLGTSARKAARDDLRKTLINGLPGTAMPAFGTLSEDHLERLIDYVMFLAIRGKTEFDLMRTLLREGEQGLEGDIPQHAAMVVTRELREWKNAQSERIPITLPTEKEGSPEMAESIRRGHRLFLDAKGAGCVTCHVNYGREGKWQYDVWGTMIKPRELTEAKRKGGSELADYYARIHGGIGAANMPAASGLSERQIWDIALFLKALPYPAQLPEEVRQAVYGLTSPGR